VLCGHGNSGGPHLYRTVTSYPRYRPRRTAHTRRPCVPLVRACARCTWCRCRMPRTLGRRYTRAGNPVMTYEMCVAWTAVIPLDTESGASTARLLAPYSSRAQVLHGDQTGSWSGTGRQPMPTPVIGSKGVGGVPERAHAAYRVHVKTRDNVRARGTACWRIMCGQLRIDAYMSSGTEQQPGRDRGHRQTHRAGAIPAPMHHVQCGWTSWAT
jgi:hypothetical protein